MFCNKLVVDYIVEFLLLKSQIDEIILCHVSSIFLFPPCDSRLPVGP